MFVSIFNDVLGPVMRGPSSSHTAGSYHIGLVARHLLGAEPKAVTISFDRDGSYASTYVQQGVDQAFVTGLMGWKQTDEIFTVALQAARKQGVQIDFIIDALAQADHPNYVVLEIRDKDQQSLHIEAKSVGGGTFQIVKVDGASLILDGKKNETLVTVPAEKKAAMLDYLQINYPKAVIHASPQGDGEMIIQISTTSPLDHTVLAGYPLVKNIRQAGSVYFTQQRQPPFTTARSMVKFAAANNFTLGEAVLEYEKTVLGFNENDAVNEMLRRYEIMKSSVRQGLENDKVDMLLLEPMAARIMDNVRAKRVAIGGIHAKAAAAAMAA
ncbi:MAG: L-serine ammonia-lyase, iron-sulfur-dependent, subunit alpha, partial [Desulforhopalus sp.]